MATRKKKARRKRKVTKKAKCRCRSTPNSKLTLKLLTRKRDAAHKEIEKRTKRVGVVRRPKRVRIAVAPANDA